MLPATVTKRGVNNESRVRSNHYGTTQQAEQLPTLRGMLNGTPQYEAVAAGYTDEVSKERMAADGTLGYQTFSAAPASSTGELLPRFEGSTAPATLTAATQLASQPSTEAAPAAPKDSLAPAGGFDLEYLKELDAAFATTSNSDLLAQTAMETAVTAPTQPLTTAQPVTAEQPLTAAQPEVLSAPNSVKPQTAGTTQTATPTYQATPAQSPDPATSQEQATQSGQAAAQAGGQAISANAGSKRGSAAAAQAESKRGSAAAAQAGSKRGFAAVPKAAAKRGKQAAGGYQRIDFSKLGIEAEIS